MELIDVYQPQNINEVKQLLSNTPNCKLLAGGTDLLLGIKRDEVSVQYLIDLGNVLELKEIAETEHEIILGCMVTFTQLIENSIIKKHLNSLYLSAKSMGSPQIRNMATIGGNIINSAAAADIIPCIISLDGILMFESDKTVRTIKCEDYFKNYKDLKVTADEVLTKIIIPKVHFSSGFYKLGKRNSLAIARINAAVKVKVENDMITDFAICLGAVGRFPFRVKQLEAKAINQKIDWLYSDEVLNILENVVFVSINGRKTMPFKKEAIKGVYKEALKSANIKNGVMV